MKRKVLLIPLIIFLAIAAALLWQLARNAEGDDPTNLESALIGKPVPKFRLESDRKSTRLNSSHSAKSRMPSSA